MFFKNSLDKKFAQWGRDKKVLPSNVSMMKEKFLSSARLPSGAGKQVRPPKFYFKILSVGLAALVLFVGVNYYRNSFIATQSGYVGGELTKTAGSPTTFNYNGSGQDLGIQSGEAVSLGSPEKGDFVRSIKETAASFVQDGAYNNRAYPPVMQNSTISDTREFSKFSYNATLKTREVEDVSTRILTIVRGNGGRVDNASIAEKYASISFVVPKDNLLQFKTEIKSLVGKKFYVESLHIQNLLPEKVGIENTTENVENSLEATKADLDSLTKKHNTVIADYQKQLNVVTINIQALRAEVTTDTVRQKQIKAEISSLVFRQGALQRQISDENKWYGWDSARLEQDIKIKQTQLDDLGTQETNLLDNVETVQGYVSVQWVSVWQMINIFVPYLWAWVIGFCILALIFNYFSKRRTINAW